MGQVVGFGPIKKREVEIEREREGEGSAVVRQGSASVGPGRPGGRRSGAAADPGGGRGRSFGYVLVGIVMKKMMRLMKEEGMIVVMID